MHRVLAHNKPNQVETGLCALAIMTKAPRPGAVKTRLQPPLTPEEAASLNVCFLQDTAAAILAACDSGKEGEALGVGVYTPADAELAYETILPHTFQLLSQRGDGFGARLSNAVEDLLTAGFASCCLLDSDSPTITAEAIREGIDVLRQEGDGVVLGPSDDGGYYLIGMKRLHRRLFEEIDWSTDRVLEQTMARAREIGLKVHTLATFFDVDDAASLSRLCNELLVQNRETAPATRKFLLQIVNREPTAFFSK